MRTLTGAVQAGGRRRPLGVALVALAALPGLPACPGLDAGLAGARAGLLHAQAAPRAPTGSPGRLRGPAGYPFRTPLASPLEPGARLGIVHTSRDTAAGWLALPDLGERFSLWLRRGPGSELAGTVAAGVFSRFDLERSDNELVEAHYRVGLQLRGRVAALAARLELYHVSSHLGDEHLQRTGREPVSTSREGLELLLQVAPADALHVYAGPGWLVRASRDLAAPSVRAGAELRPPGEGAGLRPYASFDLLAWDELGWDPLLSAEAGIELGGRARLAFSWGRGPSRAEQFFREEERLLGFILTLRR